MLTSTLTFCGAVQAIVHAGLRPVLVDVDDVTGLPTTESVELAAATVRPEAMVVVHWAGDPVDTAALAADTASDAPTCGDLSDSGVFSRGNSTSTSPSQNAMRSRKNISRPQPSISFVLRLIPQLVFD